MRRSSAYIKVFAALLVLILVGIAWASPHQQAANLFQKFLLDAKGDMEVLADQVFEGTRPPLWTANNDLNSNIFVADLWFNNELLADNVFGGGTRPDGWFGATSSDPEILGRNVRHDLELIADEVYGDARTRPEGWVGARPLYRCSRTLQNLARVLDISFNSRPQTPDSVVDFCGTLTLELQDSLLPPVLEASTSVIDTQSELSALRGDLERLVDERQGVGSRQPGWVGNRNAATATFIDDLIRDLEAYADLEFGVGIRPTEWKRAVTGSPELTANNLRFDLEFMADSFLGGGVRPSGWQGTNPAGRCDPLLQALVILVDQTVAAVPIPEDTGDPVAFCNQLTAVTNDFAENPPVLEEGTVDNRLIGRSRLAFAYLDVAALQYMGVMPYDTEFRAIYRNFRESNMMLVSGEGFVVFIDRRWTTLPEETFINLDTLEGKRPLTFCDANWCNGPGPTPTPTGDGPLIILLSEASPEPTRSQSGLEDQGKRLVSWNNIRVNYLLDRPETASVQVTLEICVEPAQVACEPVTSVFDTTTGTSRPIVSTFNGLNVYEMPYGYKTNFIIEGATLFSRDIWISDPTIRGG